jgi:hypothetical protein
MPENQTVKKLWNDKHDREVFLEEDGSRMNEMSLLDISQLDWGFRHYSYDDIIAIFNFVKKSTPLLINMLLPTAGIIHGHDNCMEVRIANHDAKRMSEFKDFIVEMAMEEVKPIITSGSLNLLQPMPIIEDSSTHDFLERLRLKYSYYGPIDGKESAFPLYSVREGIYGSVWDEVQKLGDSYIFVAHATIPFMTGFRLRTKEDRISLTEKHITEDPYEKFRRHPLDDRILTSIRDEQNRNPVIIDKAYTGRTLKYFKEEFPEAKTVALFPKTRLAIQYCDYFVFNNRLFENDEVDISDNNWYFTILKKSILGGVEYGN